MVEQGEAARIVNTASMAALLGVAYPGLSLYTASKHACLGFSDALRAELAPHRIGVTAICPGMIATSIFDDGRISAALRQRAPRISAAFRKGGAHPDVVARAILDAVRTNPAVRPVGRDAWTIWAMTRVAPSVTARVGALLARRLGAAD
jgi:short-subunit dehydrogenase